VAIHVLEQTGMRVGELAALEWGDVDRAELRLRIRTGKTNAARRWVPVPEWLMEEIEATCPPDDRTAQRRVFPGSGRQTIGNAMRNACKAAGLVSYSPHDLRHRYISVKIREGVSVTQIAAHVGHSRKSLTLDTYAHVLIDEGKQDHEGTRDRPRCGTRHSGERDGSVRRHEQEHQERHDSAGRHQPESEEGTAWSARAPRAARHPGDYRGSGSRDRHSARRESRRVGGLS
jgi:Phage integrase family